MVNQLIAALILAVAIAIYALALNQDLYPIHENAGRFFALLTVAFFALRKQA